MDKNLRGAMTDNWLIAVEGGLASLALHYCRLVTGQGQYGACLAFHPASYPSTCTFPKPLRVCGCYRQCECDSYLSCQYSLGVSHRKPEDP